MKTYKTEFVRFMLETEVLTFGEFVTKSGRNTPYFINAGNYRTGKQIARLGEFYAACITEHIEDGRISKDIHALFGPAYKGIPIAVATAIALSKKNEAEMGFCFNRKEEKDHGEGGAMVGYQLQDKDKILIVEDVITAGTAVRETLPILKRQADVIVEGLVISVDRLEKGNSNKAATQEIIEEFNIPTFSIVTIHDIVKELPKERQKSMEAYMEQYCVKI